MPSDDMQKAAIRHALLFPLPEEQLEDARDRGERWGEWTFLHLIAPVLERLLIWLAKTHDRAAQHADREDYPRLREAAFRNRKAAREVYNIE